MNLYKRVGGVNREISKGYVVPKGQQKQIRKQLKRVTTWAGLSGRPMAFYSGISLIMVTWQKTAGKIKPQPASLFSHPTISCSFFLAKNKGKPKCKGGCRQNQYRSALWRTRSSGKGKGEDLEGWMENSQHNCLLSTPFNFYT